MDREHRNLLDLHREYIVPKLKIKRLWPKLFENKIYNKDDINILRWQGDLTNEATIREIYSTIKTRGPSAFNRFITSLRQSDHQDLADILEGKKVTVPMRVIQGTQEEFFLHIQKSDTPLKIQVEEAVAFLDGPEFENVQRYPMRKKPRGLVLIVTNINYNDGENVRKSAAHDDENLQELFVQMGFTVIPYRDLTKKQLLENVEKFSRSIEFRKVDSCFVIISSHGNMNTQYEVTEIKCISSDIRGERHENNVLCTDILEYFTAETCPFLAGKPKIFIFQLCRGDKKQNSVEMPRHATDGTSYLPDEMASNIVVRKEAIRNWEDMLLVYATLPGHVAYRDKITGSWFIQILCEVFMKHAKDTHVQDLLNMVDERLKTQRTSEDKCQTLVVTSLGFHKHCYLNPGLFE